MLEEANGPTRSRVRPGGGHHSVLSAAARSVASLRKSHAAPRSKRLAEHAPATGHLVNWHEPSLPLSVQPLQKLVMAGQLRQ
jgi:hypothetical protein